MVLISVNNYNAYVLWDSYLRNVNLIWSKKNKNNLKEFMKNLGKYDSVHKVYTYYYIYLEVLDTTYSI